MNTSTLNFDMKKSVSRSEMIKEVSEKITKFMNWEEFELHLGGLWR